jgi:U6 snRNA-associated Sm-like protein LSm1
LKLVTAVVLSTASFDHFANIVLESAVERIVVQDCYADIPFGILVVRGENVMLLGELDPAKEAQLGLTLKLVTEPEIRRSLAAQSEDNVGTFEWPLVDDF